MAVAYLMQKPRSSEAFKFAPGVLPYGIFTDVKILWAGPRGFCLSGSTLKQKHRSGLRLPTQAKQFACSGRQ